MCRPAWWPATGLQVSSLLARFERVGNVIHVRDLSTAQKRRAGAAQGEAPPPGDLPAGVPGARPTTRSSARSTWP